MQVARYWRNKKLLYQLRRRRVQSEGEAAASRAPAAKKAPRREKEAIKAMVL